MSMPPELKRRLDGFNASDFDKAHPTVDMINKIDRQNYRAAPHFPDIGFLDGVPPRFEGGESVNGAFTASMEIKALFNAEHQLALPGQSGEGARIGTVGSGSGVLYFTDTRLVAVVMSGKLLGEIPIKDNMRILCGIDNADVDSITLECKRGKPNGNVVITSAKDGIRSAITAFVDQTFDAASGNRGRLKSKELQRFIEPALRSVLVAKGMSGVSWKDDRGDLLCEFL